MFLPALRLSKKALEGVGGAAAPLTFIRIRRLCRRGGLLILLAKSIPYKFGRPLVGRICFLAKVVKTTFATRWRRQNFNVLAGATFLCLLTQIRFIQQKRLSRVAFSLHDEQFVLPLP